MTATTSQEALNTLLCDAMPPQGHWTDEQYLWLTDRTRRMVEFTDGRIEELPMPTIVHQAILAFLHDLFKAYLGPRGGFGLFAGLRVRVREGASSASPTWRRSATVRTPATRTASGLARTW